MTEDKIDIKSLNFTELQKLLEEMGEKKFRAKQLYEWIHKRLVLSFDEMTNLSKDMRKKLDESCTIEGARIIKKQVSSDGTAKFLMRLSDGNTVESVLMKYKHGNSVCISTQVGCRMGCTFCASTVDGLERNLLAGEMAEQIYEIQRDTGERVSNVVLMGSGEPLDNFDNVMDFLTIINDKNGAELKQHLKLFHR